MMDQQMNVQSCYVLNLFGVIAAGCERFDMMCVRQGARVSLIQNFAGYLAQCMKRDLADGVCHPSACPTGAATVDESPSQLRVKRAMSSWTGLYIYSHIHVSVSCYLGIVGGLLIRKQSRDFMGWNGVTFDCQFFDRAGSAMVSLCKQSLRLTEMNIESLALFSVGS